MRRTLALAAAAFGAAALLPASPASAVCYEWMYELTGYCSPCNVAGHAYRTAADATGVTAADEYLHYVNCSA